MSVSACEIGVCAGQLTKPIIIEELVESVTDSGGDDGEWGVKYQTKAAIAPASGSEIWYAARCQSVVSHSVTMRYKSDVTAAMRLRYRERVFNIRAVINIDEADQWLKLLCDEGGNDDA
jgi:SPP1 family predicted phage head-tail adaptor